MSSSTTTALSRQPLVQVLRNVADPRDRRGVRHDLPTVLSLAITGVLAGCRSLTVIWEHTTDLTAADLRSLGVEAGQALPSESTIRRVLQDLDPADVDAHLRSWLCTRTGTINGRTVIAVDGIRPCAAPAPARTQRRTSWPPWTTPRAPYLPRSGWPASPTRGPGSQGPA